MPKFFETMDKIKPAYDWTYKIVLIICKLLLIADILITSYAVAGRLLGPYIPFLTDPAWTEEVVLTSVGAAEKGHFSNPGNHETAGGKK